ncbi:MAG: aminomethyl-transferring glycine dehydrogenase subunit GcvPA [Thermomicrobiales bacterium]|nr:aminomethyl-transferring glycine dehydrogenase subunit GcvPA [Thermomicrobiales bacterium]
MVFNPHTTEDRREMLETIGIDSVEELFAPVPEDVRFPELNLPRSLTEMEASRRMQDLANMNLVPNPEDNYMGAGSYQHYVPATVGQVLSRGEFYTAYTPYQPEVAQGTLQVIYEFQSMVAALLGTEVANASMYDGATAFAEGALMTVANSKKKHRIVLAGTVHPAYRQVMHTYVDNAGVEVTEVTPANPFLLTVDDIAPHLADDVACVAIAYPNFFGAIEDVQAIAAATHAAGTALVVTTSPVPLSLLKSPGELGADVVTAEGQSLGVAQSYGGPYIGLLGSTRALVRQMPGRIAGVTTDSEGKRGYVLTLQTREQHIRREKATSNICTNQGLMATAATVYMSTLGPEGFREVGQAAYANAHYLAEQLATVDGFAMAYDAPFFNEFTVQTSEPASVVLEHLLAEGILGGVDLGQFDPAWDHLLLIAATELNSKAGIDHLIETLRNN